MKRCRLRKGFESSGHTLVEVMIVGTIMLLLTLTACQIWEMGVSTFLKTDRKAKLVGDLQMVTLMLREQLNDAARPSFSFSDTAQISGVSFLSPRELRQTGDRVTLDPASFSLRWRKYEVFYLEKSTGQLFFSEVPVPGTAGQATIPTPIETFDAGGGPRDLAFFCASGRRLCDGLDTFTGEWKDGTLVISLSGVGSDPRAIREERVGWDVVVVPRN